MSRTTKAMTKPSYVSPWCDTCSQRIVWRKRSSDWTHIDQEWKPVVFDHEPTGRAWDRGEKPPVPS